MARDIALLASASEGSYTFSPSGASRRFAWCCSESLASRGSSLDRMSAGVIRACCRPPTKLQEGLDMSNNELLGKHKRLREELSAASAKPFWETAHIHRITSELAAV